MTATTEESAALAAAELHHAWLTGIILALVAHRGAETAREFVFGLFRRQHLERFLPGLQKLELDSLPHAIAAARYHYFSNQLGGVKVEYLEVDERKAWIRYPPSRWIWNGTAICAIPSEVNRAMLYAWHAHNGVSLGNPRLGFVCTGTTVDGAAGLEGYYIEYDHEIAPSERLRFVDDEPCPPIDRALLPRLDSHAWPALRQAKAYRNYAMEYIRNALPLLVEQLGADDALAVGVRCGRQIGMQSYDAVAGRLGVDGDDAASFAGLFGQLLRASGDEINVGGASVERETWRLFDAGSMTAPLFDLWRAPFEGLLAVHNRFLTLSGSSPSRFTIETSTR